MKHFFTISRALLGSIFFIIILGMASAEAQSTFYVRAGATGLGNGSDWNNAFGSLPATLVRGATYYIADGNYSRYTFDDPVSGTQVITIKKATVADHGTSTGWQNTFGDGTAVFTPGIQFQSSYYVFDGQTRGADWRSGYGFKIDGSGGSESRIIMVGLPFSTSYRDINIRYTEIAGSGRQDDSINDRGIQVSLNSFNFTV